VADNTRKIDIECLRYNPETDAAPRYQTYNVPFTDDMSVLQGLQYIKDELTAASPSAGLAGWRYVVAAAA